MYDIVRVCARILPFFSAARYKPPFLIKKEYEWPVFWVLAFEWLNFSDTHVYAHIFARILVKPLFSHLHKAVFRMTRVICKLTYMKWYIKSNNSLCLEKFFDDSRSSCHPKGWQLCVWPKSLDPYPAQSGLRPGPVPKRLLWSHFVLKHCKLETKGPRFRASPASLRRVIEQDTLILA